MAKADTVDSLYQKVRDDVKGNINDVNMLIIQLDAQGWADTLVTFTDKDRREKIEAMLSLYMAYSCYDRGLFATSEELTTQTVALSRKMKDSRLTSDALTHLSATLFRSGKIEQAMQSTFEALAIDSTLNDAQRLSSSYNNLAALYLAARKLKDAERFILKAIDYETSLPEPQKLPIRYGIASEIYSNLEEYDKALAYISKAYDIERKEGNAIGAARRQSQMADIYLAKKDYKAAERLYTTAIETLRSNRERSSLVISLKQLGKLYSEQNMWNKCLEVLEESDTLLHKMGNNYQLMQHSQLMADALLHLGRSQDAARYYEEALKLHDEVLNDKVNTLCADFNTRHKWSEQDLHTTDDALAGWQQYLYISIICILCIVSLVLLFCLLRRNRKTDTPQAAEAEHATGGGSEAGLAMGSGTTGEHATGSGSSAAELATGSSNTPEQADNMTVNIGGGKDKNSRLTPLSKPENLSDKDDELLFRFRRIVMENPSTVDIEMITKRLEISHDTLSAFTYRVYNMTPKSLIQYYKMEHATTLLLNTNRTINDIAMECGYYDNSYFNRVFTRIYDMSPGAYRKMNEKSND